MSKKQTKYIRKIISNMFSTIPYYDAEYIIISAQSPHLKHLPISIATWLCSISYIRHNYTDYDSLLQKGFGKEAARYYTAQQINDILHKWQSTKQLNE